MYFRRLNFKIPNCLRTPRKTNYSVGELSLELINKTLDNEIVLFLRELKVLDEINEAIQTYVNYYIYGRYFHYCELKQLPKKQQYMKPINAIQYFKTYNTTI